MEAIKFYYKEDYIVIKYVYTFVKIIFDIFNKKYYFEGL